MNKLTLISLCTLVLAQFPASLFATEATINQCLSGAAGNNHLINQLSNAKSQSPITSALTLKYNLEEGEFNGVTTQCTTCEQAQSNDVLSTQNKATAQLMRSVDPDNKLLLNTPCLEISGKVEAPTTELKCPENKVSAKYNFCFNSHLMRYQNAVITDFYKCVKKLTNLPLTPGGLFEMYSLESGFKPHYAYSGGVGMGQLTGIFVDDVNQKHRGYNFLKQITNSQDTECEIAKKIAAKDVKSPLRLAKNRCKFVEYGEGMERNVLYTLIGLANSWEKDLSPLMKDYDVKHGATDKDTERAKELALLNAYGPGGRAAARAAIRRLSKLTPTEFVKKISQPMYGKKGSNLTSYIGKMKKRQDELLKDMTPNMRTAYQKEGARSCVNN